VTGGTRNAILLAGGALAFAGLVELALGILPAPHQPFHYLLAGTLATAVTLATLLTLTSLRRAIGKNAGAAGRRPALRAKSSRL
jgi:hypothetical protein